jgi:hypothetical protein
MSTISGAVSFRESPYGIVYNDDGGFTSGTPFAFFPYPGYNEQTKVKKQGIVKW